MLGLIALLCVCSVWCSNGESRSPTDSLNSVKAGLRRKRDSGQDYCRPPGQDGRDGRDGRDGLNGLRGPPGPPGSPGISSDKLVEKIVDVLKDKLSTGAQRGDTTSTGSGGAVYTRWGRERCSELSETLYSGIMAGAYYGHTGSGSNHLCLPRNPEWNRTMAGFQSKSYIYGTEFQNQGKNAAFDLSNSGGKDVHQRDASCAVCYTPGRLSHVMLPARLQCPDGWTEEYLGFLMAARSESAHRSEYVCVDQNPDTDAGTVRNDNGNLLYVVEAKCGSLPCPPYVEGHELSCIVCTK